MTAIDEYPTVPAAISPTDHQFAITPSDTDDLPYVTRAIWVGTAGDINYIAAKDSAAVIKKNVPVGMYPWRAKRVMATSTTAADLVGDR